MTLRLIPPLLAAGLTLVCGLVPPGRAADPTPEEFFEKEVRPLLAERCQTCHGGTKAGGGLSLTSRDALLKGGERGPAVVPGKPAESLLLKAVGHGGELKMPPKEKLSPKE